MPGAAPSILEPMINEAYFDTARITIIIFPSGWIVMHVDTIKASSSRLDVLRLEWNNLGVQ